MTANSNQPNPNDAVLGGQGFPLNSGVLGGLEGVKQRLTSESEEIRIAALDEALNYGQPGKDVLRQVVKNETGDLQLIAYNLLSEQVNEKEKQELQTYLSPDLQIALKFDLEIDTKELGEAIERAVDRALGRREIASADSHSSILLAGTAPMPPLAGTAPVPPPITDELLALSEPVDPTEVYRIAAPCWERRCQHFDGHQCHLIQQIVEGLPTVVKDLPPCRIRQDCRWWQQEGKAACLRCPQIVRTNYGMSETVKKVIEPHRDREIM